MKNDKIIGIALIIIGAGLLFWGYDIYDSVGSHISRAVNGEAPMKAYAFLVGGAVAVVLGIMKLK